MKNDDDSVNTKIDEIGSKDIYEYNFRDKQIDFCLPLFSYF